MIDSFTSDTQRQAAVSAFEREADLLAKLENIHIPHIYDRFSENKTHYLVMREVALGALELLEIDACGFDKMDRAILAAIIDKFDGGPVGVDTLAAAVGEESDTIGDVYEPYLLQEGFIARTTRGRVATQRAYAHLNRTRPGTFL
jgi:Holliday junction DNA helicase RuvB